MKKRVLILLYNMGGPQSVPDVKNFLTALFSDNDLLGVPFPSLLQSFVREKIITKRLKEVEHRYALIGGGSPQLSITQAVCDQLKKAISLSESAFHIVDIQPLMRYTSPRISEVLNFAQQNQIEEIWLYSQYPHCSRATTGSSLRDIGLAISHQYKTPQLKVRLFQPTAFMPSFVSLWSERIRTTWDAIQSSSKHILVSAHSLPKSYIAQGDPYAQQIIRFALDTLRPLGLWQNIDWTMCWQSAVGPAQWLQPFTPDALVDLRKKGVEDVLVWPVSFVSDHIETTYELDMEYGDLAKELGFKSYSRVPNLNSDDDYIQFSKNFITQAMNSLSQNKPTALLRDMESDAEGEGCNLQPGGCLCARYYKAGIAGKKVGVPWDT